MNVLLTTMIGFSLTLLLHVVVWRTLRPRSPARALIACACLASIAAILLSRYLFSGMGLAESLESLMASGGLAAAYLISLPGIESESPSFLIVTLIESKGQKGATGAELAEIVNDETFVLNRLRSLETEGLVVRSSDRLQITPSGRRFLRLFTLYHVLAGRTTLGG